MKRALALVLCACNSGGGVHAPASASPCATREDVARTLAYPVGLDVQVFGPGFTWPDTCTSTLAVRVLIDDRPWCNVEIPCSTSLQAPEPSYACSGEPFPSGRRVLRVEVAGDPRRSARRTMSLPVMSCSRDGELVYGAHLEIRVTKDGAEISEPTAFMELRS